MSEIQSNTLEKLRAGALTGAKRLDLSCNLKTLPEEVFDLADSLEILNLSGNQLTHLPDNLSKLKKLKIIFCSNNPFTHVPEVLSTLPNLSMMGFKACNIHSVPEGCFPQLLQWLILTDNNITSIPRSIGDSKYLQKCMLAGNKLNTLPIEMQNCSNLELLRISTNEFTEIPDWILKLPKLSWLAFAGNLMNSAHEQKAIQGHHLANIEWPTLTLNQQLGEGASGVIHRATWIQNNGNTREVAVKLFKGSVTSDGLPESEMAAFIAAGAHPNLSAVEGILSKHPTQVKGLVMPLIDPSFKILANPPSFASCSRDVYVKGQSLPLSKAINIALGVAKATAHLHQNGMIHGDLYGHNILHNEKDDAILSDFGGASFSPQDPVAKSSLQKIEVRAYGCLLEELIQLVHNNKSPSQHPEKLAKLSELKENCMLKMVTARPVMSDIVNVLQTLMH